MPIRLADEEILVVDDDESNRSGYANLLREAGYLTREAADGRECLFAVDEREPSLILLDVSMPGLDGIETLRRLRAGKHKSVAVMLVTGKRFDPESIGSGIELGADEYLCKPVRPSELKARIRALLRLQATRRELEQLKRDQTAMLVHDLKQPLAVISLRAEFIADEATDPEMVRSGEAIHDACRQMEALINSVLELTRVEAGQLRLQRVPYALDSLVSEVTGQIEGLAERRGITLAVHLPHDAATVEIDRLKIVQVLQNLLGNALKFTPAGGTIDVTTAVSDDQITVSVEDSGCGLSSADAARVFDKWQQTQSGRARGGSGLGLAIARAIVEAHGGSIGAGERSDGQRGARFWFVLPRLRPRPRILSALG